MVYSNKTDDNSIAYYATTNTQLINCVNYRLNNDSEENADLFVFRNNRLSANLLLSISRKKIFNKIVQLDISKTTLNEIPFGYIPFIGKIIWVIFDVCTYHTSQKHLKYETAGRNYTRLITFGFWGTGADICYYFLKRNPNIKIHIVEEGIGNYICNLEAYASYHLLSKANNLHWFLKHGNNRRMELHKMANNIQSIALYRPESFVYQNQIKSIKLLPLSETNLAHSLIYEELSINKYQEYNNKNIYYILQGWIPGDDKYEIHSRLIRGLVSVFGCENVIIKDHPRNMISLHPEFPYQEYDKNIFYDQRDFFFEALIPHININEKIIVTHSSSLAMYPNFMFNKEPIIIFTHELFPKDYNKNKEMLNLVSSSLKDAYSCPNRIYVPKSLDEYTSILKNIKTNK